MSAGCTGAGGGTTDATGWGTAGGGAPRSQAASARTIAMAGARMGIIVPVKTRTGNHRFREDE
jgi:hypothetical protein